MRAVQVKVLAAVAIGTLLAATARPADLKTLIEKLPAQTKAEAHAIYEGILKDAPASLVQLVRMLQPPEKDNDAKVRYALHGLATYVKRPGAEAQRKVFVAVFLRQLDSDLPASIKGFLIRQLHLAGGSEAIEGIGKRLLDPELSEYAAQALLAIGDPAAVAQFRQALPKAKGRVRLTIIQDLGVLRAARGLDEVRAALGAKDRELRLTAAFALANSGDEAAVEPLLKAAEVQAPYERSQVVENLLLLARRLGESGKAKQAERICRHLLRTRTAEADVHVRCAALLTLAGALGARAMDDVLAAMNSKDPDLRKAGIAAAIAMPGEQATQRWVERMKAAEPAGKIAILDLLARRGDKAALPPVLGMLQAPDAKVRLAAIEAAARLGDERAVVPLARLFESKSAAEAGAARQALIHIPGQAVTAAILALLPRATPPVAAGLLEVLGSRRDKPRVADLLPYTTKPDRRVRAAAIAAIGKIASIGELAALTDIIVRAAGSPEAKAAEAALVGACRRIGAKDACVKAVAPALDKVKGNSAARAAILRVLGSIGNRTAYLVVRQGLSDPNDQVREAAIRALAEWPDDAPAADLLEVARSAKTPVRRILALRGYVRMIGVRPDRPAGEALAMCRQALALAPRDEERRLALGALGNIPTADALALAQTYLDKPALKNEAAVAVIRIARAIGGLDPQLAKEAIAKATAATKNPNVQKQAKDAIAFIERNEGFVTVWLVCGPFPGGKTRIVHPPEKPGAKVKWKLVTATGRQPGFVDLAAVLGNPGNCAGFLRTKLWSPKAQRARLEIGSDDGVKVWLNGKVVHDKDVPRSFTLNEDKVPVDLKAGWNELLVKVVQGGGGWCVAVRVCAADGRKLEGLRLKAE